MSESLQPEDGDLVVAADVEVGDEDSAAPELADDILVVIAVRNIVIFPGAVTQVAVGREMSIAAAKESVRNERRIGLLLQKDPSTAEPRADELHTVGTTVSVVRFLTTPNGMHYLICQGEHRFRATGFVPGLPFLATHFVEIDEPVEESPEIEALARTIRARADEALALLPEAPPEIAGLLRSLESPGVLADAVASLLDFKPSEKQTLLETFAIRPRLEHLLKLMTHRLQVLNLSREIGEQTQEKLDERQRQYLLREQLKTIRKELGEDQDHPEIAEIRRGIDNAGMTPEAEEHARKELKRLEAMPEAAAEHSAVRTYLEWLTAMPWTVEDPETIVMDRSRQILDEDHYGLERVKRRILEYLAVRKLNPEGRSPILCFVGPPGVGKTSLGQSIARALGLRFVRTSLGGVHDEAEIRGHRRTYVGSMPGTIVQRIRKAGSRNPVFMLDEMDKLGVGFHGDPSSALLEVLDPEQNSTFRDHYLDVAFDLSRVLFIGTANVLDAIPAPLRDRMEVIELPGYTHEEKLEIARRYLLARQLEANGLKSDQVSIDDEAIDLLIDGYTREAGVRNLERQLGGVLRNAAVRIAEGSAERIDIGRGDVAAVLGPARYESEVKLRTSVPGVATGLAWTPVGGDILFIEASRLPGSNKLILTGHLGDVMKESARAALTLVKSRTEALHAGRIDLGKSDIHIHVPAGAIPKDGPSAGAAIFVALASLLSGRTVRHNCAMTGEISLRGLVLPVGGIKEKVLAALRAGIETVILPERNRKDLHDVPASARSKLDFVFVSNVDAALEAALESGGDRSDTAAA